MFNFDRLTETARLANCRIYGSKVLSNNVVTSAC